MAWLPAFKYIKGLMAPAGLFMQPNGEPYEGSYHELYNGKTFTGDIPSKDSVRIYKDDSEPHLPDYKYENSLVSEPVYPSPEDYEKGFFMRYYIKDHRDSKLFEVEKQTYIKKIEEKFLSGTDLKWILDKPIKDIFNQGYLYKGAITRNKENTKKASIILNGLDLFITEYDKFVDIQSDVKGYKFEELPRMEKVRIIRKISNLQSKPKVTPKPRFKKKLKKNMKGFHIMPDGTRMRDSDMPNYSNTPTTSSNTTTSSGGGGGGGGGGNQYFDSNDGSPDGSSMGNSNSSNNTLNNY